MPKSERNLSTRSVSSHRPFVRALKIATLLHGVVFFGDQCGDVWTQREDLQHMIKENVKGVLNHKPLEKEAYINRLKEDMELGVPIDLGEFHLQREYLAGRSDKNRVDQAAAILDSTVNELESYKERGDILYVLQKVKDSGPRGDMAHSYLSSALIEGIGNCQSTERYDASIIHRLYPDLRFSYQAVRRKGVPHTRLLVDLNGKWHSMDREEDLMIPMADDDLESTVIYEKYDRIKDYVGEPMEARLVGALPTNRRSGGLSIAFSDNYTIHSAPDGIWWPGDLKEIGPAPTGAGVHDGLGYVGGAAPIDQNRVGADTGMFQGQYVGPMMELELLDASTIARNQQETSGILDRWRFLSQSTNEVIGSELMNFLHSPQAWFTIEGRKSYPDLRRLDKDCVEKYTLMIKIRTKLLSELCSESDISGELSCPYDEAFVEGLIAINRQYWSPFSEPPICDIGRNLGTMLSLETERSFLNLGL